MSTNYTIVISIFALVVSAISLFVSTYGVFRDRGRLKAFSEIIYDLSRGDTPAPSLRLRVVNSGRRPVVLTNLVRKNGEHIWSTPLKLAPLETDKDGFLSRLPDFSEQNTALRLEEGEIYEFVIHHEELLHHIHLTDDAAIEPKCFYVEDSHRRKHHVQHSKKNLEFVFSYRAPNNAFNTDLRVAARPSSG